MTHAVALRPSSHVLWLLAAPSAAMVVWLITNAPRW